LKTPNKLH
jgi:serine/threonine protein phosphatase PrpC